MKNILFLISLIFLLSSCTWFTKVVKEPVLYCPKPAEVENIPMYSVLFTAPTNTDAFVCMDKNNSVNMLSDVAILQYQLNSCNKTLDGYRK